VTDEPELPGRRTFLQQAASGVAVASGSSSAVYGALFGRHDYRLETVAVPLPGLARTLDGFTIVQLSDIHFGAHVGEPELRSAVELVRKARADLVVLTGDLIDHDPRYAPLLGRLVRHLEPLSRFGTVAIPGNHDYYAGVDEVLSTIRAAGGVVLRNAGRVVGDAGGGFALVGVDDVWAPRNGFGSGPDLDRATAMVPAHLPRVLLCHNPEFFPEATSKVQLQLSGHTHGGQVNLLVRPAELFLPYIEGLYEEGGARLYVNRGFGTAGPPARIGAPPEVTKIVLTA
jgi:predicted MPP superfamily phosphohydrolase